MKFQVTPVTGIGPTPIVTVPPVVAPTVSVTPLPELPPTTETTPGPTTVPPTPLPTNAPTVGITPPTTQVPPTPTPSPTPTATPVPTQPLILADFNNGAQGWQLDNGVSWNSGGFLTYALTSGSTLRATGQFSAPTNGYTSLKLRVNSHGSVIFYNSSVFINGALQAPIANYCTNGDHYNGWQDVVIPLSVFASPQSIQSIAISFYTLDSSATVDLNDISLVP